MCVCVWQNIPALYNRASLNLCVCVGVCVCNLKQILSKWYFVLFYSDDYFSLFAYPLYYIINRSLLVLKYVSVVIPKNSFF